MMILSTVLPEIRWIYRALASILLVAMSVFDIKHKKLPIFLLSILGVISLIFSILRIVTDIRVVLEILFGLLPGALLIMAAVLTKKVGIADGIIICALGMAEGFSAGLSSLCFGTLILSVISIIMLCIKRVNKSTEMPFVPFILVGYIIWIFVFT